MTRSAPATSSVADRFGWLLTAVLVATGFAMWSPSGAAGQLVALVLQGGVLLLALRVAIAPRRLVLLGQAAVAAIVLLSLGLEAAPGASSERRGVVAVLAAALVAAAIAAIVGRLLRLHAIDRRAVLGALCCYLLLGTLFAYVFGVMAAVDGGRFFAGGEEASLASLQYFSFTTLTTVGYGDLAPVTRIGRSLSIVEALIGQIYLVTVVAMLVGNVSLPSARRPPAGRGPGPAGPADVPDPED